MKPPRWTDIYPHGTKEGDEEQKFFIAIARNPKYQWRSVSAIARETGLDRERVEQIIEKYFRKNMIFQNPKNEDQWGYWERVPEMLPKTSSSLGKKDQDDRIKKACSKNLIDFDLDGDECDHDCCKQHTLQQNVVHIPATMSKRKLLDRINKLMDDKNKCEKTVFFNDGKDTYAVPESQAAKILNPPASGSSSSSISPTGVSSETSSCCRSTGSSSSSSSSSSITTSEEDLVSLRKMLFHPLEWSKVLASSGMVFPIQ